MLYLIGLGLGDEKDITVNGLEAIKRCSRVYLEHYTSVLGVSRERLEEFYGRPVLLADRETVESDIERIIEEARTADVAMLVVGDPYGATTHSDLALRAAQMTVPMTVIHNASIVNAAGCCGLQLYHFGQIVSIVFFTPTWRPDSFYDKIAVNRKARLHTLCLLDIKVKEPTPESLARGKPVYLPPRFMAISQCIDQLLEVEAARKEGAYTADTKCFALARVGQPTQLVVSGSLAELKGVDFGAPLHSLVLAADDDALHPMEREFYDLFHISKRPDLKPAAASAATAATTSTTTTSGDAE